MIRNITELPALVNHARTSGGKFVLALVTRANIKFEAYVSMKVTNALDVESFSVEKLYDLDSTTAPVVGFITQTFNPTEKTWDLSGLSWNLI
jgi:hypothetical protein